MCVAYCFFRLCITSPPIQPDRGFFFGYVSHAEPIPIQSTSKAAKTAKDQHLQKQTSPQITQVPLSNRLGQFAKINTEDYKRLMALGVSQYWMLNSNGSGNEYVRVKYRGNLSTVARLILGNPSRQMVTYLDGDRTNLCRDNLLLGKSGKKYGRNYTQPAPAPRAV